MLCAQEKRVFRVGGLAGQSELCSHTVNDPIKSLISHIQVTRIYWRCSAQIWGRCSELHAPLTLSFLPWGQDLAGLPSLGSYLPPSVLKL